MSARKKGNAFSLSFVQFRPSTHQCSYSEPDMVFFNPSPLGATKTSSPFMGSRCFSRANEELVKRGWKPIDWRVDEPLECNVEKSPIMEEWSKNFKGACEDYDV